MLRTLLFLTLFAGAAAPAAGQPASGSEKPGLAGVPFAKCWEYHFESTVREAIVSANGTVYLAGSEGRVRAISGSTSKVMWSAELGGEVLASLAIPHRGLIVVSSALVGGKSIANLRSLDLETGLVRYSTPVDLAGTGLYLSYAGERLLVSADKGLVSAFNLIDGSLLWRREFGVQLSAPPAVSERSIAVAAVSRSVSVLDIANGAILSAKTLPYSATAVAIDRSGIVFAGDGRGNVARLADNGAGNWRFKSGAKITQIVPADGRLLVSSNDNFLYFIDASSGGLEWKRRLEARLTDAPLVRDGVVIAPIFGEETAAVIEIATGRIIDRIQLGEGRYALSSPVMTDEDVLVFAVPGAAAAYAQDQCGKNEKAADKKAAPDQNL